MAFVNITKSTLNPYKVNTQTLNEGQFSWMTLDTEKQIGSEKQNTIDVFMYDNEGNQWHEGNYEGYGEFGGMDFYTLLAKMNGYSDEDLILKLKGKDLRDIGIDIAFGKIKTKAKGNKVLFPALVEDPKFNWKRHDFKNEPESDPDQSWYQEDEYEQWDESLDEGTMSDIHMMAKAAKDSADFIKTFFKKYGDKIKKTVDSTTWAESLYKDTVAEAVAEAKNNFMKMYPNSTDLEQDIVAWYRSLKKDIGEKYAKEMRADLVKALMKESKLTEAASLVDEVTGKAVKLPYKTKDFRGDAITVKGFTEPHKSSSSGRIQTDQGEFFPGVAGVKIVGHKFEGVTEAKSNIAKKWDSTNTMMDDLREFITDAKDAGGEELVMDIADALKLMTNYAMGMTKESKDLTWNSLKESLGLNEGRSINKISKEHSQVVVDMKQTVDSWKEAEGDRKSELLEMLRELNKRKSELEKELDDAVAGKDRNVQLALEEGVKGYDIGPKLNEGFSTWEIEFEEGKVSGVDYAKAGKVSVKARNTVEAIKKAVKEVGNADDWMAVDIKSLTKI